MTADHKPGTMQRDDFEILEHPADAKIRAHGSSLEEAFANAAKATFSVMADLDGLESGDQDTISLEAEDEQSLLYDFLDELIYLRDVNSRLYYTFEVNIKAISPGYRLQAEVKGCPLAGFDSYTEVKAVTYNQMEIRQERGQWQITVVLDI